MTENLEKLREIYNGVPVLDDSQKQALLAIFRTAVGKAQAGELPASKWEESPNRNRKAKTDPRERSDRIIEKCLWISKHDETASVKDMSVVDFARAHQLIRTDPQVAEILYGDSAASIYDSDLFFALNQVYKPLQLTFRR